MQWLANVSVRRPVFATVLILFLTVVGIVGYNKLSVDRFPKVEIPVVAIVTRLAGAAPEQIETEVSDKIEEGVNTISGIDELRSVSSEGVSQVFITFLLEKNVDVASQEVRDRLSTVLPLLPKGTDPPVVTKVDPDAAPVLLVALDARRPVKEITELADQRVRHALENVPGVGQVTIIGGRKRQIQVRLDPIKLRAAGLTAADVQRAIVAQNATAPGGAIETGPDRLTVRVKGRVDSVPALGDVVVREQAGHAITINEVGKVVDGEEQAETTARSDGRPAVVVSIRKQSGENSVQVVDALRARIAELQRTLPGGYTLEVIRDNTETTRTSVAAVREHLTLGALLASLVVLLFLGSWRSTIIAALAIPTSIVATFGLMWAMGFSLDTITLLALALSVGIVIDDAIVVLDNIYRYIHEKGARPQPAAIYATREIGLAVLATTLSLLAVFMPVAFMGGIPGRFLRSFGLTMGFAIAISLFVSFSLTPMLASRWLRRAPGQSNGFSALPPRRKYLLERVVDVVYTPLERGYMRLLRWVMRRRWVVVVASVLAVVSIVPLGARVPKGFLPKNDEGQFEIVLRTPEGTSLAASELAAERIARRVRAWPVVARTIVTIGDSNDRSPNLARIFVGLLPPERRRESQDEIQARVRQEIVAGLPPGYRAQVSPVALITGGGVSAAPVQYTLAGPDLQALTRYSVETLRRLRAVPGAADADSSLVAGNPEVVATIDRPKASDLGVSVADIASALQLLVGGVKVSQYEEQGREYDIEVRADEPFRTSVEALSLLTVPSARLGTVPLLDVVALDRREGPSQINRLNRQRQVSFSANVAPGAGAGQIGAAFERQVAAMKMPPEYRLSATGQSKEIGRTARNFAIAFALAFVFMYLILAAQFESWLHPVTILIALPLTVPFALISLLVFKQALDIYSMLGILVLFGVIKKNAILQIDHTNQLRAQGLPRLQAILQGNRDRLRPILMTTFAFVAGMIPLVVSKGVGAGFNRATAGVVVGGQLLSLALTLVATPVAYSLFDDASVWVRRKLRLRARPPEETGADEIAPVPAPAFAFEAASVRMVQP
jgi:hydrophobic/amphiphilic exporter-1 (mainly G- bacteria), HAE1 family